MSSHKLILKPGALASPQEYGIMRQVQPDNLDPGMERERWQNVYIKEDGRYTGWPNNRACKGREILLLLEQSDHLGLSDGKGGWIVLFEEQTWYVWTANLCPLNQ
ncbi:MAG: hypothetical protein WC761_00090 [Candidatus Paceibacterota bacterium]|jgi:hypothetical protein